MDKRSLFLLIFLFLIFSFSSARGIHDYMIYEFYAEHEGIITKYGAYGNVYKVEQEHTFASEVYEFNEIRIYQPYDVLDVRFKIEKQWLDDIDTLVLWQKRMGTWNKLEGWEVTSHDTIHYYIRYRVTEQMPDGVFTATKKEPLNTNFVLGFIVLFLGVLALTRGLKK